MRWFDVFGNLAFILIAFSLLAKDILWLRALSVISSVCAIIYNYSASISPWTPIRWNLFFIGLNLYHISKIVFSRKKIFLTEKERDIYQWFFKDLSVVEFAKFIRAGHFETLMPGTRLTEEGLEVKFLRLIYSGKVDVLKNSTKVSELRDGDFVGEMSFLSNRPATATVVAHHASEVLTWNQKELKNMLVKSPSLIYSLQGALGAQLSRVLEEKNDEAAVKAKSINKGSHSN